MLKLTYPSQKLRLSYMHNRITHGTFMQIFLESWHSFDMNFKLYIWSLKSDNSMFYCLCIIKLISKINRMTVFI